LGGVARFEVGGHPFPVDARQVLGEESHADPAAGVGRVGAEQAELVVRLVPRCCLESLEQLHYLSRTLSDELF
jgi:hypothetical protein